MTEDSGVLFRQSYVGFSWSFFRLKFYFPFYFQILSNVIRYRWDCFVALFCVENFNWTTNPLLTGLFSLSQSDHPQRNSRCLAVEKRTTTDNLKNAICSSKARKSFCVETLFCPPFGFKSHSTTYGSTLQQELQVLNKLRRPPLPRTTFKLISKTILWTGNI